MNHILFDSDVSHLACTCTETGDQDCYQHGELTLITSVKDAIFTKLDENDAIINQAYQAMEVIEARERRRGDLEGMVFERLKRQQEALYKLLKRIHP